MNIVPTFLLTSTSPKYFGCVFCPDVLFLPQAVSLLDYARFESKQKWTPSSRIWTSDLWISALFPTTVHRSTNWAIEGTCLLSVNARAKANTRRWGVACFLCFINKSKSGWPRGLRRCVQVAVHFCGRGFESHFWQQTFFLQKWLLICWHMFTYQRYVSSDDDFDFLLFSASGICMELVWGFGGLNSITQNKICSTRAG